MPDLESFLIRLLNFPSFHLSTVELCQPHFRWHHIPDKYPIFHVETQLNMLTPFQPERLLGAGKAG